MDWSTFFITVTAVAVVALIGYRGSEKLAKDNRKHLRQMATQEQENRRQIIQEERDYRKQKEQEKEQTIKEQFAHSITSRTHISLHAMHSNTFPEIEIAASGVMEGFQSFKAPKGAICKICKSFMQCKAEQGILIQDSKNFTQYKLNVAAQFFGHVIQQLDAIYKEYFSVGSYLRSELNELTLIFGWGQEMERRIEYIDDLFRLNARRYGTSTRDIKFKIMPDAIDDEEIRTLIYKSYQRIDTCLDNAIPLFYLFVTKFAEQSTS